MRRQSKMKSFLFYASFVVLAFYALSGTSFAPRSIVSDHFSFPRVSVSVLSIKCYVCKEPDRKCRDPFQNDTMFLKDCSQLGMANATMCRKYMWESKEGKPT